MGPANQGIGALSSSICGTCDTDPIDFARLQLGIAQPTSSGSPKDERVASETRGEAPPVVITIEDEEGISGTRGMRFSGGVDHRVGVNVTKDSVNMI